jgi:hypothetical protein
LVPRIGGIAIVDTPFDGTGVVIVGFKFPLLMPMSSDSCYKNGHGIGLTVEVNIV